MAHKGRLAGVLSGQGRYAGQELVLPDLQVSTGQGKSGDRCWQMRRIIALRRSLQGKLSSPSGGIPLWSWMAGVQGSRKEQVRQGLEGGLFLF